MTSYVLATTGAVATALTFNRVFRNSPPIYGRFVPFLAVVAANCINIPIIRSQELRYGIPVYDQNGVKLGYSTNAAQNAITSVILSRIAMFGPPMLITPFIMNHLERRGTLCRYPWAEFPIHLALIGAFLVFTTPLALAFFKQQSEMKFCSLEPPLRRKIYEKYGKNTPYIVFYNKGL